MIGTARLKGCLRAFFTTAHRYCAAHNFRTATFCYRRLRKYDRLREHGNLHCSCAL